MPGFSVPITLADGKERHLRYDFNAIIVLEEQLGVSIDQLEEAFAGPTRKMSTARDILWAGLIHEDKALTKDDVGALVDLTNINAAMDAMVAAVSSSFRAEGDSKNA